MSKQEISLMIDFETLGVSRDSVLLSCGIILFDKDKVHGKFYQEFDITEQIIQGSTINEATIEWWKGTDQEELKRLMYEGAASPYLFLNDTMYIIRSEHKIKDVWSRGHMDFEILNYHLDQEVEYWKAKDCRTLDVLRRMDTKNTHNALEDCKNQVQHVQCILNDWEIDNVE